MIRFSLNPNVYSDRRCRTGVVLRRTSATHWPMEVRFDDGTVGYVNSQDYETIEPTTADPTLAA